MRTIRTFVLTFLYTSNYSRIERLHLHALNVEYAIGVSRNMIRDALQ